MDTPARKHRDQYGFWKNMATEWDKRSSLVIRGCDGLLNRSMQLCTCLILSNVFCWCDCDYTGNNSVNGGNVQTDTEMAEIIAVPEGGRRHSLCKHWASTQGKICSSDSPLPLALAAGMLWDSARCLCQAAEPTESRNVVWFVWSYVLQMHLFLHQEEAKSSAWSHPQEFTPQTQGILVVLNIYCLLWGLSGQSWPSAFGSSADLPFLRSLAAFDFILCH